MPHARSIKFDPNASYILVGGGGGLGRSISTWMVERGARQLILLSPTAGESDQSRLHISELNAMGCTTIAIAGHVEDMNAVQQAVHCATAPIRGVLQLAMVLDVSLCQF